MKIKSIVLCLSLLFTLSLFADEVKIQLAGFCCPLGAKKVDKALSGVKGVSGVKMDADKSIAYVSYDKKIVSSDDLVKVINKTGYKVEKVTHEENGCSAKGVKAVDEFHKVLHTMHEAVDSGKLDLLNGEIAAMKESRNALLKYGKIALEKASCKESKAAAEKMNALIKKVSKSVDKLENCLHKETADEIEKVFGQLHDNFYRILDVKNPEKKAENSPNSSCMTKKG